MTIKHINQSKKKSINDIQAGSIVKKNGDMFIVAKISEAQFKSIVDEALFGKGYGVQTGVTHIATSNSITSQGYGKARRDPSDPKFVLISLITGTKFYPEFLNLYDLKTRLSNAGFEAVEEIEINELRN